MGVWSVCVGGEREEVLVCMCVCVTLGLCPPV